MTYAKIIADSISEEGVRLTTMEVRFHRFVLAEFNTHRVFSRNSASSRAIPVAKQIQRVRHDPAVPVSWPTEQKGMQGGEEIQRAEEILDDWQTLARDAALDAEYLATEYGLHKSLVNRILEPFMWHTVVVTATAWQNFFDQRCSPLAQPEIRVAAEMMRDAFSDSSPRLLMENEWHLPYIESVDWSAMSKRTPLGTSMYPEMVKVSAARCARVSYLTQGGERNIEADLALYDRLVTAQPAHWSPLEHVATPWHENKQGLPLFFHGLHGEVEGARTEHLPRVGNLLGWRSLRTEVEAMRGEETYS